MSPQRQAEHDDFEVRLRTAVHDAGAGFEADPAALAADGEARGRRMVRRRRAAVMAGAAAVTCAAVGGALLAPWTDGAGDGARTSAAAGPKSPSTAPSSAAGDKGPISAAELVRTLEGLLPKGKVTRPQGRGTGEKPPLPYAEVVFDDGGGAAAIAVSMSRVEGDQADSRQTSDIVDCPDKLFTPYDGCTTSRLSDGSRLKIFQGYEYPDRRVDTKRWTADLLTPQGLHIGVSEWNAPAEKGAPVTRPQPPLSTGQLKTLVTAAAWRRAAAAIPERPVTRPSTTRPAGISGSAIEKTLASLLPKRLRVTAKGGQETEYGYLVVDDGKGASMVQINVQPDMSDVAGELFGSGSGTLPDGTRVTTHQGPGDDKGLGLVMWTADTMRPGGMRVVVSAFNSGSQSTAPTREDPALTLAELKAIATSAQWAELR